jgi:hypothetical protein
MTAKAYVLMAAALALFVSGASLPLAQERPTNQAQAGREMDPEHVSVPDEYRIEAVVANLTVPTTATFDGDALLIAESGYNRTGVPRIVRVAKDGTSSVAVDKASKLRSQGLPFEKAASMFRTRAKCQSCRATRCRTSSSTCRRSAIITTTILRPRDYWQSLAIVCRVGRQRRGCLSLSAGSPRQD